MQLLFFVIGISMTVQRKATGLKGFEPLTDGLRARRSTYLSYRPNIGVTKG